jgi:hypothetical protein
MLGGMKEKPISVRFQKVDKDAVLEGARLEGLEPALYIASAAVRFTRDKHPEAFAAKPAPGAEG